jgi:uncharacterized membrane protein YqjE
MVDVAKGAAEDLLDLFTAEIKLARLELSGDLHQALKRVARVALFIPPLIVGYGFAMAALASWLGDFWGRPKALASVAALQIVVAGLGLLWSIAALRRTRVLEKTSAEVTDGVRRALGAVSPATRSLDA